MRMDVFWNMPGGNEVMLGHTLDAHPAKYMSSNSFYRFSKSTHSEIQILTSNQ